MLENFENFIRNNFIFNSNLQLQLQSNILSAVNNKKWSEGYGCTTDTATAVATHSDAVVSGDLFPGGDTCDADGCTRRGPEQVIPKDLSGVEKVHHSRNRKRKMYTVVI